MTKTNSDRSVQNKRYDRYEEALKQIPAPGCGCHTSLLSVANMGAIAGIKPQQIFDDLRQNIPIGSRRISDREIQDAVNKALSDRNGGTFTPKPRPAPVVQDGKAALQRIIGQSDIDNDADLWELSPIRLLDEPQQDPALLLKPLFDGQEFVFIGEPYDPGIIGKTIRRVSEWIDFFKAGGTTAPHIIVNHLTGDPASKESGDGDTYRGNGNVAAYKYCLVEFDNLSHEDQTRFWSAASLPIVALIDTGGKSIHAWLDVQKMASVSTLDEWKANIEGRLYDRLLAPLGIDKPCSNPARLSRLPGHFREEKGKYQRLLWLSPEGRPVL